MDVQAFDDATTPTGPVATARPAADSHGFAGLE
jgi:hypothetical protein